MTAFKSIPARLLQMPVALFDTNHKNAYRVKPTSPAILAMTDLRDDPAITIKPHVSIDAALNSMKQEGVRLLFVMDSHNLVTGLITATDILGDKPVRLGQERNLRHNEIDVSDLMTPYHELEVISMARILQARVGDIVMTLQHSGRQHALVIDIHPRTESRAIRGIFSTSQISRQLVHSVETAQTERRLSEAGMEVSSWH